MKKESTYVEVGDLEVGDIFFVSREWGFCEIKDILGISFYNGGQVCFGLEPVDATKPKKYIEKFFKQNKKVRLYD